MKNLGKGYAAFDNFVVCTNSREAVIPAQSCTWSCKAYCRWHHVTSTGHRHGSQYCHSRSRDQGMPLWNWAGRNSWVGIGMDRGTKKPDAMLTCVRVPGALGSFLLVNFQCRLSNVVRTAPMYNRMHQHARTLKIICCSYIRVQLHASTCTHVKNRMLFVHPCATACINMHAR